MGFNSNIRYFEMDKGYRCSGGTITFNSNIRYFEYFFDSTKIIFYKCVYPSLITKAY